MKKVWTVLLVVLLFGLLATPISAASALNSSQVPEGSKLVVNITYKVVNDEDSGNVGYWALESYNREIKVWQTPDGSFYAIGKYEGKWQTFKGALSPGMGVIQAKDAQGTMNGGWVGTFTATVFTPAFGNIGTFDFGGTSADVMLGTYGAGQTGPATPVSALSTYFPGYTGFTYLQWGWDYKYKNQTWSNFDIGTTGDIVT